MYYEGLKSPLQPLHLRAVSCANTHHHSGLFFLFNVKPVWHGLLIRKTDREQVVLLWEIIVEKKPWRPLSTDSSLHLSLRPFSVPRVWPPCLCLLEETAGYHTALHSLPFPSHLSSSERNREASQKCLCLSFFGTSVLILYSDNLFAKVPKMWWLGTVGVILLAWAQIRHLLDIA